MGKTNLNGQTFHVHKRFHKDIAEADAALASRAAQATAPSGQPAAGWYPDPRGEASNRYWDGQTWTDHTA